MRIRWQRRNPDLERLVDVCHQYAEPEHEMIDDAADLEPGDTLFAEHGRAVRAHVVDGRLLAELVASGVFRGDESTGRFLVSLGDDQAEQMIDNGRRAFRLLLEEAELQLEERRPRTRRTVRTPSPT